MGAPESRMDKPNGYTVAKAGPIPDERVKRYELESLLHSAAAQGNWEKIPDLLKAGAYPTALNVNGDTPLHRATRSDRQDVVEALVDYIAKSPELKVDVKQYVNCQNNQGLSSLHLAAINGNPSMIMYLIDRGADVNKITTTGQTPLHFAALCGRPTAAEILIKRGANIDAKNNRRKSPGELAADMANTSVCDLIACVN